MKIVMLVEKKLVSPSVVHWLQKTMARCPHRTDSGASPITFSRFDIIGLLGNGADFAILEQATVFKSALYRPNFRATMK